jgi:hypothetical protein
VIEMAEQRIQRVQPSVGKPSMVVLPGGRNQSTMVALPKAQVDETRIELLVSRDDRIAHASVVRRHLRVVMRSLASGHYAAAGMWLVDLERINEQEATRALSTAVEAVACPDCENCVRLPGHGAAA